MESLSQILADWGYWGLFFSAFIAGSILPFSSEAVMIVLVHMGLDPVLCVAAASLGNTLGGMSYTNGEEPEFTPEENISVNTMKSYKIMEPYKVWPEKQNI